MYSWNDIKWESIKNTDNFDEFAICKGLVNCDGQMVYVERQVVKNEVDAKMPDKVFLGVMPKGIYDLAMKYGVGFSETIIAGHQYENTYEAKTVAKTYDECSDEELSEIKKRSQELGRLKKKIDKDSSNPNSKYDKKGVITLPIYDKTLRVNDYNQKIPVMQDEKQAKKVIEIEVTQRELIEAGFLPEDFNWHEPTKRKNITLSTIKGAISKFKDKER